jgi:preprotein translocase subunit SecE
MPRSTRQQRRQRRAQAAGTPPLRPAPRQRPAEEEAPVERAEPRTETRGEKREEVRRGGIPFVGFLQEAIAELKKVEWPGQQAVVSGTAVVLVACLIVGAYLYLNDQVWKYVVQHLIIR